MVFLLGDDILVKLPSIISSGMVLEKVSRIWGYSNKERVKIEFDGKKYVAKTLAGKWELEILSTEYGGPFEMKIEDIIITDVYVGRVFCASGQSNMELPVSRVRIKYEKDLENTYNENIRVFNVNKEYNFLEPQEDCIGKWEFANNDTINDFFATSYFFAKKYLEYENIPIGIINTAAGGSKIESWLKEDDVKQYFNEYELLKKCKIEGYIDSTIKADENRWGKWHKELDGKDDGMEYNYILNSLDFSKWNKGDLDLIFSNELKGFIGSVWFKKTFYIESVKEDYKLFLGTLKDADITYVNGIKVGETGYQYPPRIYIIPKEILKIGENTITVRLIAQNGQCSFTKGKELKLESTTSKIILNRNWYFKIGGEMEELKPATFFYEYPTGLYNKMLYPILKYSLSGFLWYQGESNTHEPDNYDELLFLLLKEIRYWQKNKIPFCVVQLPNFDAGEENGKWQILRKKQESILNYEKCGLVITLGMGEDNDLHPLNKKDVGIGLADSMYNIINNSL